MRVLLLDGTSKAKMWRVVTRNTDHMRESICHRLCLGDVIPNKTYVWGSYSDPGCFIKMAVVEEMLSTSLSHLRPIAVPYITVAAGGSVKQYPNYRDRLNADSGSVSGI